MGVRYISKSFSAGELTPELFGRVDFDKFQNGLALCRNFMTLPHGPAINRTGTQYVSPVKNAANFTRLIPFNYNNQQTFAIEVGAGYFRWHTQGATLSYTPGAAWVTSTPYAIAALVTQGGNNYYCVTAHTSGTFATDLANGCWYLMDPVYYEIPNSYAAVDLPNIHYVQSADVLTLVHPGYPPTELRRYGAANWQLSLPSFTPPSNCPTSPVATPTLTGAVSYSYVVTSLAPTTLQESVQSAVATCTNDLTVAGHSNKITWTAPTGTTPVRYTVYKLANGIYGYIGISTDGVTGFVDNNITPDISTTPPLYTSVLSSTNNYPAAVSYNQQRRWFAGTTAQPQNFWASRSGTESDMSYTIPSRDDNSLAVRIAAREASAILHIIPMADLLLLTASGEWKVSSTTGQGGVLTPTTLDVNPQSHIGANNVTPVIIGNVGLYGAGRGGHLREIFFNWQVNGYVSNDVSQLATHLFDYNTLNDMAYSRGPYPIVWCVSSSGNLLGLTYLQNYQVSMIPGTGLPDITAWHHHDTGNGDIFEACCVITENNEDFLYVIVRRAINGVLTRYVERLHTRYFNTLGDAFFVDCGTTYFNFGSFVRTGTSMAIYMPAHGLTNGQTYSFSFTDTSFGLAPAGTQYVVTVVDVNNFTITVANAGATTGYVQQQVTALSGLTWLEGRTVNILMDGAVQPPQVVTGGALYFVAPGAKIQVGLPIQADLQTMPLAPQTDPGYGQGRMKNVNKAWLRLYRSSGLLVGPDFNTLTPMVQRTTEPYGSPPNLVSDEIEVSLTPQWGRSGQICIRQNDPLPVDLAAITFEVAVEG